MHSDPATEAKCLVGGMIPKSGIDTGLLRGADPDDDESPAYVRGGRWIDDRSDWRCLHGGIGTVLVWTNGFPPISNEGALALDGCMACIVAAALASADRPVAMTRCCGGDLFGVHIHFRGLLQLQEFRSELTIAQLMYDSDID